MSASRSTLRSENLERLITEAEFFVEKYFNRLKEWTFLSEWLELEDADCLALASLRTERLQGKDTTRSDHRLGLLAAKIDECIARIPSYEGEGGALVVVRLSSRSAKDVVLFKDTTISLFLEEDARLIADAAFSDCREDVRQLIAMMRAAGRAMAVRDGASAIELFVESERIGTDLREHLRVKKQRQSAGESVPTLNVIIRQYVPLACELELRVFVVARRVAAISQYYASLTVPALVSNKQAIESRIFAAVETILPLLDLQDFVIDFAIDLKNRLWVVELNLPPPVAGMALFDRDNPADVAIVKGQAGYEFRVRPLTALSETDDVRTKHQLFFQKVKAAGSKSVAMRSAPSRSHRRLGSG